MRAKAICAVLLSCCAASAFGQVTIASFNTLHYGWGANTLVGNKDEAIAAIANSGNISVIALQEVMVGGVYKVPPGGWFFHTSKQAFGPPGSNYHEYYVILVAKPLEALMDFNPDPTLNDVLARPPFAVQLRSGNGLVFYVADFHATFGRAKGPRRAEAWEIAQLAKGAPFNGNVVIAADWNLTAQEVQVPVKKQPPEFGQVVPDLLTTVTKAGRFASAYDHFATLPGAPIKLSGAMLINVFALLGLPGNSAGVLDYWSLYSDHIPITTRVSIP